MDILRTAARSMQQVFGPELENLAIKSEVIQRQRKFDAITLLRTLVFTVLKEPRARPSDFQRTAAQFGVHTSKAAIVGRFSDRLATFLLTVLQHALQHTIAATPSAVALFQGFSAVLIGDATTIALPNDYAKLFPGCGGTHGSGQAAMKIQVLWDFLTGTLSRLVIEPGKSSDAKSPIAQEDPPAKSLSLFDLGYFCLDRFRRLGQGGSFWISRLQFGTKIYDADGQELAVLKRLQRHLRAGQWIVDMPIFLGTSQRLPCRLIAVRIPQEVASRRRQKAREKALKHNRAASAEYLQWQDWTIFVTNCEPAQLTWKAIVILYRCRWQIELLFKVWKSHNGLAAHRPEATAQERLSLIYAKLIGALMQHWIIVSAIWCHSQRSLMKAAVTIREWVTTLADALDDLEHLVQTLNRLATNLEGACVERRRQRPSQFQLLEDQELLDWKC